MWFHKIYTSCPQCADGSEDGYVLPVCDKMNTTQESMLRKDDEVTNKKFFKVTPKKFLLLARQRCVVKQQTGSPREMEMIRWMKKKQISISLRYIDEELYKMVEDIAIRKNPNLKKKKRCIKVCVK